VEVLGYISHLTFKNFYTDGGEIYISLVIYAMIRKDLEVSARAIYVQELASRRAIRRIGLQAVDETIETLYKSGVVEKY
jgi:hypothetical protein